MAVRAKAELYERRCRKERHASGRELRMPNASQIEDETPQANAPVSSPVKPYRCFTVAGHRRNSAAANFYVPGLGQLRPGVPELNWLRHRYNREDNVCQWYQQIGSATAAARR